MKKTTKFFCTVLAITMLVTAFTGCTKNATKLEENLDEQVVLKWVLMGNKKEDSDKVWGAFNEGLKEKLPNTQVDFTLIPSSDFQEKWQLMMSAQESIDMAWSGWMLDREEEVRRGSYMELTELLEKYGPNIKAAVPEYTWKDQMVDGGLYYLPNVQMMVNRPAYLYTSDAKAEAYMDKEKFNAVMKENAERRAVGAVQGDTVLPAWDSAVWDEVEKYLSNLKEAGRLGLGFSHQVTQWLPPVYAPLVIEPVCYVVQDETGRYIAKAIQTKDSPYREDFARMADFYQKGYIRKDIQTATPSSLDNDPEQGYVFSAAGGDDYSAQAQSLKAGETIYAINTRPLQKQYTTYGKVSDTNFTIPRTAKHPVRAMQLYNMLNSETDTELYNLLVYGIEGEHYEKISENRIKQFTPAKYEILPWVVANSLLAYETDTTPEGYNNYVKNVLNNEENIDLTETPLTGFHFDETLVKSEMVQINSVLGEYKDLEMGINADWELRCEEMEAKLVRVGIDKVVAELQRQLDEKVNK